MKYYGITDKALLEVAKQAFFTTEVDNGNSGGSKTIDWTAGNKQKITLTGSPGCTFTFTPPSGPCNVTIKLIQGAGGSKTVSWPGTVWWVGRTPPVLSTVAGYVDLVTFYYDGANYLGVASINFG